MITQEFSDQFDILWNNVTSNQAPGLNEYEKSVFLTKAQSQLVKEYFNNRVDAVGGGFDGSQKRQYDFSGLIRTESLYNINTYADRITGTEKLDRRSLVFLFPQNYFLAVNEIISDDRWQYAVIPLDYAEYQRLMMKPYSLPVKRAAWRLNTDKKNCNYLREYVPTDELIDGSTTEYRKSQTDYVLLSSWADEKRNLQVTIRFEKDENLPTATQHAYPSIDSSEFYFIYEGVRCTMSATADWDNDRPDPGITYVTSVYLTAVTNLDDEEVIEFLKDGFRQYKEYLKTQDKSVTTEGTELAKACRHMDGYAMCSAPSHRYEFAQKEGTTVIGKEFTTNVTQIPFVEIIGKFRGEPKYQLRYVRSLEPIILEDLYNYGDDLTIDGVNQRTECRLPVECHEEILERAVTLAKIAWAGGTATTASQASKEK